MVTPELRVGLRMLERVIDELADTDDEWMSDLLEELQELVARAFEQKGYHADAQEWRTGRTRDYLVSKRVAARYRLDVVTRRVEASLARFSDAELEAAFAPVSDTGAGPSRPFDWRLAAEKPTTTIEVDVPEGNSDAAFSLLRLLKFLRFMGDIGTSRSLYVEYNKDRAITGWDGDGASKILEIRKDGKPVESTKEERELFNALTR